jgi:aminopeptidase N
MLVNSGLANPTRATTIGSITPPASSATARSLMLKVPQAHPQVQRPLLRYQGKLKPRSQTE